MYEADKQIKFIELRAEGWSLGHIVTELHMSKHTAVNTTRLGIRIVRAEDAAKLHEEDCNEGRKRLALAD